MCIQGAAVGVGHDQTVCSEVCSGFTLFARTYLTNSAANMILHQ